MDEKEMKIAEMQQEICQHDARLSATDYKVIKCAEAKLLGEDLPYDIKTLHAERQAVRDKINAIQSELGE